MIQVSERVIITYIKCEFTNELAINVMDTNFYFSLL